MRSPSEVFHGIINSLKVNRTIIRGTEDIFRGERRIRIVVLGSKESGKTVFLTALASNLRNHCKGNGFDLNQWEAYVEEDLAHSKDKKIADFPYFQYREGFAKQNPEWPTKTTDMSVLRLPLRLQKDGCEDRHLLIEILDLPGERIADLTMAKRSYREWCSWMFRNFGSQHSANGPYNEYLEKAKYCFTRYELFNAYKAFLLAEYEKGSPWIVPSVVKLTQEGKATEFLKELNIRTLGLTLEEQFVPVPIEWFSSSNEWRKWTKDFASAYDKYKEAVVDPICDWLSEADQLVYLVDILHILRSGPAYYNREKKFGEAVLSLFSHRKPRFVGGAVWDYLVSMFKTRIKSAYLVVTKMDLASEGTSYNLIRLADQFLGKELRGLMEEGIGNNNIVTCAAVDTVSSIRNETGNEVTYARMSKDKTETTKYEQVDVPEVWPCGTEWNKAREMGTFWFEDTYPLFDEREDASPPQLGLDNLVKFLLSSELA